MSDSSLLGISRAIENTDDLMKRLHGDDLRAALLPAAKILYEDAFRRAPYDPGREKGTHLRDALFIDAREHKAGQTDVLVGVNHRKAPHAHLFELGWSRKPEGIPYLRPAAVAKRDLIMRAVGIGVRIVAEMIR